MATATDKERLNWWNNTRTKQAISDLIYNSNESTAAKEIKDDFISFLSEVPVKERNKYLLEKTGVRRWSGCEADLYSINTDFILDLLSDSELMENFKTTVGIAIRARKINHRRNTTNGNTKRFDNNHPILSHIPEETLVQLISQGVPDDEIVHAKDLDTILTNHPRVKL